jgi:hypothetical protein
MCYFLPKAGLWSVWINVDLANEIVSDYEDILV